MEPYMEPFMDKTCDTGVGASKNFDLFKQCKNRGELVDFYTKWAKDGTYEEHMKGGYNSPVHVVEGLKRHIGQKLDTYILDVGSGTGLVGEELRKQGFSGQIDALDGSEGMLAEAKQKHVYTEFYHCYFGDGDGSKCVESDKYGALISSGCFGHGHMTSSVLPEMVRLVRSGGLIVLGIPTKIFIDEQDPEKGKVLSKLLEDERLEILENSPMPDFFFEMKGELFILRVKK